jgi:radical SAM superfamily enzyme YgiQ (UPF0313 family)
MNMKMFQPLIDGPESDVLLLMIHTWYPWMPPLGISYISSYLESKGYKTLLFDFNAKLYNHVSDHDKRIWDISTISSLPAEEIVNILINSFLEEINELIDIVLKRPEPIVGFSTNYLSIHVVNHIAKIIKNRKSDKLLVVGGPGCFWDYDRSAIEPGAVDLFVLGEGERPFYRIVKNFYNDISLDNIAGTISVKNGKELINGFIDPINDLSAVPHPSFKNLDLNDYGLGERNTRTLPILTSRGCISKCTFCVDHMMCYPFRMRDPESIIEEIKFHIEENNVKNFAFNDLLCNGDLKKLGKLAELIKRESLNIEWGSYAIARGDMSLELLKSLKDSGCSSLCYGIESGSDKVLKIMKKMYTASDAERALRLTKKAGIKATFNIIIGYPGECRKDFKQTLSFVKRNRDYIDSIINVSTLFINPAAELGMKPGKFGIYFFKQPNNFKFISLKRLLMPKRYEIFDKNLSISDLKGIDISDFISKGGNTKPVRLKRLVKMLYFLQNLDIFKSDPIINVYTNEDIQVKRAVDYVNSRKSLVFKDTEIKFSKDGFAKIFFNNSCITTGPGLDVSLRIKDDWYGSSRYTWGIKKIGLNKIKITIKMQDIFIEQKWVLEVKPEGLYWKIYVDSRGRDLALREIKAGLQLSENYKYWGDSKSKQGILPDLNDNWQNLDLDHLQSAWVKSGSGDNDIIAAINRIKSSIPLALAIESSFLKYGLRLLLFKSNVIKNSKSNKLRIKLFCSFENVSSLFLKQQKKLDQNKNSYIEKPRSLNLDIDRGAKIYYKNIEISSERGAFMRFDYKGKIFDSRDTAWAGQKRSVFGISWNEIPFEAIWKTKLKHNSIIWNIQLSSLKDINLSEFKFGICLDKRYNFWSTGLFKGNMPDSTKDRWDYMPIRKSFDNKIILKSLQNGLPQLYLYKPRRSFFQTEVTDLNISDSKIAYAVIRDLSIKNEKPLKFSFKLVLKAK